MTRTTLPQNRDWTYVPSWRPEWAAVAASSADAARVDLPHANLMLPFNNFDEKSYQFISCYQKRLALPAGEKLYLDFEGIASSSEVYVEGELAATHECGYTPFAVDLSRWAGKEVLVSVKVDSTERPDVPPFGNVIDYLTYGGVYREASLRVLPSAYIANVHPRPAWDPKAGAASLAATVFVAAGASGAGFSGLVRLTLLKDGKTVSRVESAVAVAPGVGEPRSAAGEAPSLGFVLDFSALGDIAPWSLDRPELYELEAELFAGKGGSAAAAPIDALLCRVGFREARIEPDGFYLNGEKVVIRGLDRHQAYPYSGYAMPARVQRRDAEILKTELGVNCVRTSHYPQSRHFLDACDELGLLVLEEIPGWQHIGGAEWKARAVENVRAMIVRDWAHPSIFLWGVRINESRDDHDFYLRTNALARSLDATRQSCGIRCIERSELLEDVYTMNDFVMGSGEKALRFQRQVTGLSHNVPYLVTENNGHMYPARRFDNEERLVEHALRHARIHDAAALNGDTAGALSWVFADYNTHCQFGAGDRICYHGVMDMFRIPKFAAFGYSAQRDISKGAVLEPLTVWARGERSECSIMPLVVMTNCDEVGLVMGGVDKGRFAPDRLKWAGLPHPPVVIKADEGAWGMAWQDAVFTGYVGGEAVIERRFAADPTPSALRLEPDSAELRAQGPGEAWDATRVVLRLVDRCGNHLPFSFDPVRVTIEGPGVLVGPAEFSLMGGVTAVWVRATGKGRIVVTARTPGIVSAPLAISSE